MAAEHTNVVFLKVDVDKASVSVYMYMSPTEQCVDQWLAAVLANFCIRLFHLWRIVKETRVFYRRVKENMTMHLWKPI